MSFLSRLVACVALIGLASCGDTDMSDDPLQDLGAFEFGVNYVFADKAIPVGPSRRAQPEEWTSASAQAMQNRLGRYSGGQKYDIGISVENYALGVPGVPIIYNPRSTLIVFVNVYDPNTDKWLARQKQLQVLESPNEKTVLLGTGRTRSREEQISGLSFALAREIEDWLEDQHQANGWFAPIPSFDPGSEGALAQPEG